MTPIVLANLLPQLLAAERVTLERLQTPERRKLLTDRVDAAVLACVRHANDPEFYTAPGVALILQLAILVCQEPRQLDATPIHALSNDTALEMLRTATDLERTAILTIRELYLLPRNT